MVCLVTASVAERLTHVSRVLTGGLELKSRTDKILHSVANCSPP